jgi:predicted Zn-dependent peptidase
MTGGIEQIESYFKTIESITSEDIIEAAKTLTKEKRTIVTLKGAN